MRGRLTAATGFILVLVISGCTGAGPKGGLAALAPPQPPKQTTGTAASPQSRAFAPVPSDAPDSMAENSSAGDSDAAPETRAAVRRDAKIALAPILGATVAAMKPLSARLREQAKAQGFSIVATGAKDETLLLQGYFSTVSDEKGTSVRYVWDVIDPSGNRLHRISGARAATGSGGSGWEMVTDADMHGVADQTIGALTAWLSPKKT